uniref:RNA polymerase II C-terminal domain phosphatase-like 4 n=1 Tax=Rhizophora mucronata TaxID=61149 RepID=A0A2P2QQL7_RHIMU
MAASTELDPSVTPVVSIDAGTDRSRLAMKHNKHSGLRLQIICGKSSLKRIFQSTKQKINDQMSSR